MWTCRLGSMFWLLSSAPFSSYVRSIMALLSNEIRVCKVQYLCVRRERVGNKTRWSLSGRNRKTDHAWYALSPRVRTVVPDLLRAWRCSRPLRPNSNRMISQYRYLVKRWLHPDQEGFPFSSSFIDVTRLRSGKIKAAEGSACMKARIKVGVSSLFEINNSKHILDY